MNRQINKARTLAYLYHAEQKDKAGVPYTEHLEHVSRSVNSDEAQVVALLHDILEDTKCGVEDLRREGFSGEVVAAVVAMTHPPNELYEDYIARVANNSLAREVKIADMTHNADLSRLADVTQKDLVRAAKYQHYIELLSTE